MLLISVFLLVHCKNTSITDTSLVNPKPLIDSLLLKNTINRSSETSLQSEITCPKCGYKKMETLPTDVCLIKYNCEHCDTTLYPKNGDCCVFCTYGTHKCPSKQVN